MFVYGFSQLHVPFPQLSSEHFSLKQFQYTGWPDHGVPQPTSLVKFIQQVRKAVEGTDAPIVVHCRWGRGVWFGAALGRGASGDGCTHLGGRWIAWLFYIIIIRIFNCNKLGWAYVELIIFMCTPISSAGVGRSGTFITLDAMMERLKENKDISIFDFVSEMRTRRMKMVQTVVSWTTAANEVFTGYSHLWCVAVHFKYH